MPKNTNNSTSQLILAYREVYSNLMSREELNKHLEGMSNKSLQGLRIAIGTNPYAPAWCPILPPEELLQDDYIAYRLNGLERLDCALLLAMIRALLEDRRNKGIDGEDTSLLLTYDDWKSRGRQVRQGVKGRHRWGLKVFSFAQTDPSV